MYCSYSHLTVLPFCLCSACIPKDEGVWDSFIRLLPPGSRSVSVPLERLRSGVSYEFRVIAVNRYGYGQPSTPSVALAGKHTQKCKTTGDNAGDETPSILQDAA